MDVECCRQKLGVREGEYGLLLLYVVGREGEQSPGIEAGRVGGCLGVCCVLCVLCVSLSRNGLVVWVMSRPEDRNGGGGEMEGPLEGLLIVDVLQGIHTRSAKNGVLVKQERVVETLHNKQAGACALCAGDNAGER